MDAFDNCISIKQGAEGKLYKGMYFGRSAIFKERFKKLYRYTDLDEHLTKERIKAECKALLRSKAAVVQLLSIVKEEGIVVFQEAIMLCGSGVRTPAIYLVNIELRLIIMEDIESSVTVKDYINKIIESPGDNGTTQEKLKIVCDEIGSAIGKIHKQGIVHGDLTTSNMLVRENEQEFVTELYLIDFGLSQLDVTPEDKGVDLYVLERSLLSTHKQAEELFRLILNAYSNVYKKKGCTEIMSKLDEVRARGRKRTMVG